LKLIREMNQGELAAYIDSHLRDKGIDVVLSGGASVAIYSDYRYVSEGLDFIARFFINHSEIKAIMKEMEFDRKGRYYFHSQTPYYVEFISGPPSVGQDLIEDIHELEMVTGIVRIISPTDSVKDRLAAYYHWQDLQSLEQALLVADSNPINLENIEAWSRREGKSTEFEEFKRRFQK